jgi:hypothetical protein
MTRPKMQIARTCVRAWRAGDRFGLALLHELCQHAERRFHGWTEVVQMTDGKVFPHATARLGLALSGSLRGLRFG